MGIIFSTTVVTNNQPPTEGFDFKAEMRHGNNIDENKHYTSFKVRDMNSDNQDDFTEVFRCNNAKNILNLKHFLDKAFHKLRRWENNSGLYDFTLDNGVGWKEANLYMDDEFVSRSDDKNPYKAFLHTRQGGMRVMASLPAKTRDSAIQKLKEKFGDSIKRIYDVVLSEKVDEEFIEEKIEPIINQGGKRPNCQNRKI